MAHFEPDEALDLIAERATVAFPAFPTITLHTAPPLPYP